MKKTAARILTALTLAIFLANGSFAQISATSQQTSKPAYKDGKFYFYNPVYQNRSSQSALDKTALERERESKLLAASCVHCKLTQSAVKSVVTGGGPIILYITTTSPTCGYGSGSIIVQAANGTAPYSFKMDLYPPQVTGNFPVMGSGVHTLTVTDAMGVTVTTQITLNDILPGPIVVPYYVDNPPGPSCAVADGVVRIEPYGGTPPYTYSLDLINFQTSNIFSNLYSGLYALYVKDVNGCIGISYAAVVLSRGCDGYAGTGSGYVCKGDGQFSLRDVNVPSMGPYSYSLDGVNYQSTGDFTNIPEGVHTFYCKDKNGKIQILGFNLAENCDLGIQYIAVSAACKQNDGSMTVTAANGTAPYTYTIDGINYQNSNVFNGLAAGNYFITVQDAVGSKSSLAAIVYDRCPVVEAVSSPETCAKNDGIITAAGFKGTAPYQYSMDGTIFQNNNSFPGLAAGNYTITIRDALGFLSTVPVVVGFSCLSASVIATPASCGNNNGSLTVTAINGTTPYSYSIDGMNFQPGNIFDLLAAGPYTITVKDVNGLTTTTNAIVTNNQGPQVNAIPQAASCANNDGSISITAVNGTAPYQYSIDGTNFQAAASFAALDTGLKTVVVKDANGCISSVNTIVPLQNTLSVDAGGDITICEGKSGTLTGTSNGNTFSWSPATGPNKPLILNPSVAPPVTTKYYLTALLGVCSKTDSVMVFVNPAPIANAGADHSVCFGKNIQLQGSGGLTYMWSPATYLDNAGIAGPTVIKPDQTITYSLTVTDINNCQSLQPATVTITVTPPAKVFAGNDTSVIKNQSLQLHAIDVNNSGFDSYLWSPAAGLDNSSSQNPIADISSDVTYTVTASTPDGCAGQGSISIKVFSVSDIFVPSAFTPNGDGHNDLLKAIPIGIRQFKYFSVYNRWGQKIFSTVNQSTGWDGTINGQLQDTGTYVWMAGGIDFKGNVIERRGTVILIR